MANKEKRSLLFELVFDPEKNGVTAISLVSKPAILTGFIHLKDQPEAPVVKIIMADEEKRIVLGPVIIPNVKIFRSGKSLGLQEDAFVYFREETVRALAEDYIMKAKNNNVTIQHEEKSYVVKMIESWIVEDSLKDKSSLYGFDLAKGTWVASFKIEDDDLWKSIKDNELAGFSIEAALGLVAQGSVNMGKFSEEVSDDREVIPNELVPLILDHCSKHGKADGYMEEDGWTLVYEDFEQDENISEDLLIPYLALAIESDPAAKSFIDKGNFAIRYKYVVAPGKGDPIIETSRQFCRDMINADLVFRLEDINQMSFRGENELANQNYSIFKFRGSYNCRHIWKRLVYMKTDNAVGNSEVSGYRPVPASDLPESYIPSSENIATDPEATKVKK